MITLFITDVLHVTNPLAMLFVFALILYGVFSLSKKYYLVWIVLMLYAFVAWAIALIMWEKHGFTIETTFLGIESFIMLIFLFGSRINNSEYKNPF